MTIPANPKTQIKRGNMTGVIVELSPSNRFVAEVYLNDVFKARSKELFDQDEAEVELSTLMDDVWRNSLGSQKQKLVRRF